MTDTKQRGPFGGLSASEAAKRSAESRASKRQPTQSDAEGFRGKLRSSLDRMSQSDVDKLVKTAKPAELVRLAESVFGRASADSTPTEPVMAPLSKKQRNRLRAALDEDAKEGDKPESA
jgi:hypothetical protein